MLLQPLVRLAGTLVLAASFGCRSDSRSSPPDTLSARTPSASTAAPAPTGPVPTGPLQPDDFAIAGLTDESDSAGVVAALGRPDSVELRAHPWDSAGLRVWHYRSRGIEVALAGSIEGVTLTTPATATARGVRVGDSAETVRAAYGERQGGTAQAWRYDDDSDPSGLHGIEFRIQGDRVASIYLGQTGHGNAPPPWEWARPPWLISGEGLGPITRRTPEQDLIRLLGRANVRRDSIYQGEGEWASGTTLFRDSSIAIEWSEEYRTIRQIRVRSNVWRTREGVALGTSLRTLEALNGRPFTLAGFFWDGEGQVCSWEGGRLDEGVIIALNTNRDWGEFTEAEQREVGGEDCRSSALPAMQRLGLSVVGMRVFFGER